MGRGARDKRPYPRRQDGQAAVAPRALVSGIDRAPVEEDRRAGWDGALSRSRVGFGVGSCRFILPAAKPSGGVEGRRRRVISPPSTLRAAPPPSLPAREAHYFPFPSQPP